MGFKVDTSFLRFLTMGALASHRVMDTMRDHGLSPIELERYSSSNKIWGTKVKRLRLPDLLCVRTGLRVEVRAKSTLAIKMSDAPDNPARRWSSGLRPLDMVAFVQCREVDGTLIPAPTTELFWVRELSGCVENGTRLGPPKSASEGSERDREWPTIVPSQSGKVLEVTSEKIRTELISGRKQTYSLSGKTPYVSAGENFAGEAQFIAGLPSRKASFSEVAQQSWNPRSQLNGDAIDRYAAAKALSVVGLDSDQDLLRALMNDPDSRVALEAAGSLAKLGHSDGLTALRNSVMNPAVDYLRMEAIFILSELKSSRLRHEACDVLFDIAKSVQLTGDESRQAAIWGLGFSGLCDFEKLIDFLDAEDESERTHAVISLGVVLPNQIISLIANILSDDSESDRKRASATFVLQNLEDKHSVVEALIPILRNGSRAARGWATLTLGSLPPDDANRYITDVDIKNQIFPIQLLSPTCNWTKSETNQDAIRFVAKQTLAGT